MRRITGTVAVLIVALVVMPSVAEAQLQKEGERLFWETKKLVDSARTKADKEKGVREYEKALRS